MNKSNDMTSNLNSADDSDNGDVNATAEHKVVQTNMVKANAITEDWIKQLSDLELSQLILLASNEMVNRKQTTRPTDRLSTADVPIDFEQMSEILWEDYQMVPKDADTGELAKARTWYIVLISSDKSHRPLPLKVMGDAVLGRDVVGTDPDVDLNPFDAEVHGISRTHALLRPQPDQLLLSDLGSTNGTLLDGEKLVLGRPRSINDQSVMSLGQLHFKVRIMRKPGESGA